MLISNVGIVIICSIIIIIFMFFCFLFRVLSGYCRVVMYLGGGMSFEVMYLYVGVVIVIMSIIICMCTLYFVLVDACICSFFPFSFLFVFLVYPPFVSFSFSLLWVEMAVTWGNCCVLCRMHELGKEVPRE